jgi:transposase-like protein
MNGRSGVEISISVWKHVMWIMSEPVCISDFESHAKEFLPKNAWDYYSSGANEGITLRENRCAFNRYEIFSLFGRLPTKLTFMLTSFHQFVKFINLVRVVVRFLRVGVGFVLVTLPFNTIFRK